MNVANMDLLRSYNEEGAWSFCASGITLCMPGCPGMPGLATFASAKQAHANPHAVFFHKDDAICSNLCAAATFKVRS